MSNCFVPLGKQGNVAQTTYPEPAAESPLPAKPVALGLIPVSRATRIANGFLVGFMATSFLWIIGSDAVMQSVEKYASVPLWVHSAKGLAYVLICGIALREAARIYIAGVERAHQAHIEAKLELVRRLARAAEYRDDETGGHNARIGQFAAIVAREMGLDSEFCDTLAYAAALHDLGKIGIPDDLLLKKGPLTPAERVAMERHTILGAEVLEGGYHPLVLMAHAVALTHHERWDGSGYPHRLREKDIPLEGRIVAVCDVFDALTTVRPYKAAWPIEDAVAEIRRGSGSHFDADVVDAFLRALPEIKRVQGAVPSYAVGYRTDPTLLSRLAA